MPTSSSTSQGTSTTTQNLNPQQQGIMGQLATYLQRALKLGPTPTQAQYDQSTNNVNTAYQGASQQLKSQMAGSGFGGSGKEGGSLETLDLNRANTIGQSNQALQNNALANFQNTIGNAFRFMLPLSSTTAGSQSGTQTPSIFSDIMQGISAIF